MVKKTLTIDDYKKCLDDGVDVCREQRKIKDHETYTSLVNKIILSIDGGKRNLELNRCEN